MRNGKRWTYVFALLMVVIIAGGAVLMSKHKSQGHPLEIILSPSPASEVEIYLSGDVADPGIYTSSLDNNIGDIIQAAGGMVEGGEPARVEIRILYIDESPFERLQETKININIASAEELQNLPGIGPTLAQRIIDYRAEHLFRSVTELMKVKGIGRVKFEEIKDLIRVV